MPNPWAGLCPSRRSPSNPWNRAWPGRKPWPFCRISNWPAQRTAWPFHPIGPPWWPLTSRKQLFLSAWATFPRWCAQLPVLLQAPDLAPRRATAVSPLCPPSLRDWASRAAQKPPFLQTLLAVGVLRLARYHDLATELFRQHRGRVPADHRRAWANEEAALAWSCGQFEQAAALWQSQAESVPILFNRGLADLFLGRAAKARTWLIQATARLSDESAWYHLGHLYLALAEMRN